MSEQNHAANIIGMLDQKSRDLSNMTAQYERAENDREDATLELQRQAQENVKLRLSARRIERKLTAEIALRDERITEVTEFCNEETRAKAALKAELESVKNKQEQSSPLTLALHMIMCAGVNQLHTVAQQLAHGTVNRETNKASRTLAGLNKIDTVVKQPSLYRSVAMFCSAASVDVPDTEALTEGIKSHIESNINLFFKDAQYEITRAALREVWAAKANSAHMGLGARNICLAFDWLSIASECDSIDHLEDDADYEELFCESLLKICMFLIKDSFN